MRIIHFSDFHLDNSHLTAFNNIVYHLEVVLKKINEEKQIDIIVFTGDMINQGGKSFPNIDSAFKAFKDIFITRLCKAVNLPYSHFIFTIGNHDIRRDCDSKYTEKGMESIDMADVDDIINTEDSEGSVKRITDFKNFEKKFYSREFSDDDYKFSKFCSNFRLNIDGRKIGISALNTAWRCWDSKRDQNNIWMGPQQIQNSLDFLSSCNLRIALAHHNYAWLKPEEKSLDERLLIKSYDMYFCGHTHSFASDYKLSPVGNYFEIVAPGILSENINVKDDEYKNGFGVIDYDLDQDKLCTSVFKQNDGAAFCQDMNFGNNGVWCVEIPTGELAETIKARKDVLLRIKENSSELDHHLLNYDTASNAPKSIEEIFVMPNLTKIDKLGDGDEDFNEESIKDFDNIITEKNNTIIFGIKEAGKTILLDKIQIEILSNHKELLPIRIDFGNIDNNILSKVRTQWGVNKNMCEKILQDGNILILIDNISFTIDMQDKLVALNSFCNKYKGCRFIGTCLEKQFKDLSFDTEALSLLNYQRIEISQFRTKQIKELARKWVSKNDTKINPKKLKALLEAFSRFNLPRTPFSISMFLWILEREDSYRALNNAVLIESFIIELLKAKDGRSIGSRMVFDYNNKLVLLSEIAVEMLRTGNENYALPFSSVLKFVEDHITALNFTTLYKPSKILKDLLVTGILIEDGVNIRFKFACFFEFMLAKRMEFDSAFKSEVLSEGKYLYFYNEIIYYTGLHRGERDILQMLIDQLEYSYIDINDIVFKKVTSIDDFFNVDRSLVEQITADDLFKVLPEKQTEDEKNHQVDSTYEVRANIQNQNVIKRKDTNKFENYSRVLMLAMNVLRNSEEIKEEKMKYNSFKIILRNSISYCILYKLICESIIRHSNKFPQNRIEEFMFILRILPNIHQELLSHNLGTYKLSEVFREKVDEDCNNINCVSEFERFLSVFLYTDVRGVDFKNVTGSFVKNFNKKYIADACYLKLLFYYYKSSESNFDKFLINNIADLHTRVNHSKKGNKIIDKSKVIQMLIDKRKEIQRDTNI